MRRFKLVRAEDVSGTSGTGIVAHGVEFPDGSVAMMWDNDHMEYPNGLSIKPAPNGIEATRDIHGHEGKSEIMWVDE